MKTLLMMMTLALSFGALASDFNFGFVDEIGFGEIQFGGSGCQQDSWTFPHFVKRNEFYILNLADYSTAGSARRLSRKSCAVSIPVQVPHGYRLKSATLLLQGRVDLDYRSRGRLSAEVFVAGEESQVKMKSFSAGAYKDFVEAFKTNIDSACGEDLILRLNSSLLTRSRGTSAYSELAIEKILLKVDLVKCHNF